MLNKALFSFILLFNASVAYGDAYNNEWENVAAGSQQGQQQSDVQVQRLSQQQADEAEELRVASAKRVRRFHEVLDELLAEFGYDVRMGQLKGLKNLSIRKVDVSDALPRTYKNYVELLVSERIRENSRVRLVSCVPCRTKTSRLVEGKLLITSPTTNLDRMRIAADQLGIDNFMDVVLVYHTTHMVLAMQVFRTSDQEMVWARTYNSETIRSRYQKLAIDYQQVAKSRPGEDYDPEYRFMFGLGGGIVPNVSGLDDDTGVVAVWVRGTEKFNNRRNEFGMHQTTYLRKNSLLKSGNSSGSNLASGGTGVEAWDLALSLYGIYAHHFVDELESYNRIRHGLNAGVGFIAASPAYLTGALRAGWDIYFGRRFTTSLAGVYFLPTEMTVDDEQKTIDGGAGGELVISMQF